MGVRRNYNTLCAIPHLRAVRESKGIRQDQLAQMAGVRQATISRLENGMHQAMASTVRKLAAALEVTPDDLTQHPPVLTPA